MIGLADELRADAAAAVAALRSLGVRLGALSGDRLAVATAITAPLALDEVRAGLLPADKAARITGERAAGRCVAMLGDGVNEHRLSRPHDRLRGTPAGGPNAAATPW